MEIKKSVKASLENKRLLFTEIGFVIALLVVYGAFEYSSKEKAASILDGDNQIVEVEDMVPITQETPPPPPEAPKIPILSDPIDIVDDEIKVDDDMFMNLEDNANMGVEIMDYVEETKEEVNPEDIVDNGKIVRLTYENGKVFILNYNSYAVTVEGYDGIIEALGFVYFYEGGN